MLCLAGARKKSSAVLFFSLLAHCFTANSNNKEAWRKKFVAVLHHRKAHSKANIAKKDIALLFCSCGEGASVQKCAKDVVR